MGLKEIIGGIILGASVANGQVVPPEEIPVDPEEQLEQIIDGDVEQALALVELYVKKHPANVQSQSVVYDTDGNPDTVDWKVIEGVVQTYNLNFRQLTTTTVDSWEVQPNESFSLMHILVEPRQLIEDENITFEEALMDHKREELTQRYGKDQFRIDRIRGSGMSASYDVSIKHSRPWNEGDPLNQGHHSETKRSYGLEAVRASYHIDGNQLVERILLRTENQLSPEAQKHLSNVGIKLGVTFEMRTELDPFWKALLEQHEELLDKYGIFPGLDSRKSLVDTTEGAVQTTMRMSHPKGYNNPFSALYAAVKGKDPAKAQAVLNGGK